MTGNKDKISSLVDERLSAIEKNLNTFTPQNKVNLSDELEIRLGTGQYLCQGAGQIWGWVITFLRC